MCHGMCKVIPPQRPVSSAIEARFKIDPKVESLAGYAQRFSYAEIPARAVHQCRRIFIDTLGCALGALHTEPVRIAREMAMRASVPSGARILGTSQRTVAELAAFANGAASRYLDANDTFPGGGGHPSDTIAAILAAADLKRCRGRSVIEAMVLAYEIYHALWRATDLRQKGMDNVLYTTVASAVATAKILGLERHRIAEAIALAATPNVALDATRYGDVAMWKGCAGGNAARNGVFAALLAQAGMTGPDSALSGAHGLEALTGPFELQPLAASGGPYSIETVTLKCFASEAHSLSPLTAALELSRCTAADEIETVTVDTYRFAWQVIGSGPEKWRPRTREAADHSLPYVIASALLHGRFDDSAFEPERLRDPRMHALMDRITIREDRELTSRFPEQLACRIGVLLRNGETRIAQTDYPLGHPRNPMSDADVEHKFRRHARRWLPEKRIEGALGALWRVDTAEDADSVFEALEKRE
ncbi:MAG: MmgE/PrpD family protein [Betaproteobacteria bacterium]|nr:MmgE/PrpD family protein [Betaproteobacteria bacterium]